MAGNRKYLDTGWMARKMVKGKGVDDGKGDGWMPAVVPGTVLTTLVCNKFFAEPFYGMNNDFIPDISDVGTDFYTYWFRTFFGSTAICPKKSKDGRTQIWLELRGVNYSFEAYVNGMEVTTCGANCGMFLRHVLNITSVTHYWGPNELTLLVCPPPHPGRVDKGGQGGDHDIAKDVTAQYVQGWDWIIPIRDRNTGIWDHVSILITGPVKIADPHLVAVFTESGNYGMAHLHVSLEISNALPHACHGSIIFQLSMETDDNICSIDHVKTERFSIGPRSSIIHSFPTIIHEKPQLWWPNGMGAQPLYDAHITVDIDGYGESDTWSQKFGFRKIDSFVDTQTGGRIFEVNGVRVFIRGGNWIVSDGMLRLSRERYAAEIAMHASANLNMIRVWGGALTERPEFYDACDNHGLLVWQEFWITGDCNGRGVPPSDPTWPLDHDLFLKSAVDAVKLLRNHPSLAIWVGGNECTPPPDINNALHKLLTLMPHPQHHHALHPTQLLDGTRAYVQGSLWEGFGKGNGEFSDGPYGIQEPDSFFKPGFYPYAFNPEVGSVGVPEADSIRASMPRESWDPPELRPLADGDYEEVPNMTWEYHKYIPYSQPGHVRDQIALYGIPKDLDSFCEQAQLANYVQYRALVESWNSRMWSGATGMLIWKTQNPWPGLRGQLYDCFLAQTAALFAVQSAAEPIHVQFNPHTCAVEIVNSTQRDLHHLRLEVRVVDLDGASPAWMATAEEEEEDKVGKKSGLSKVVTVSVSVPANTTVTVLHLPMEEEEEGGDEWEGNSAAAVHFVLLRLLQEEEEGGGGGEGKEISRNVYWRHRKGGDYSALGGKWRQQSVPVHASATAKSLTNGQLSVQVRLRNAGHATRIPTQRKLRRNCGSEEGTASRSDEKVDICEGSKDDDEDNRGGYGRVAFWLHLHVHHDDDSSRTSSSSSSPSLSSSSSSSLGPSSCSSSSSLCGSSSSSSPRPRQMLEMEQDRFVDTRILPVHYSENYISLFPGEERTLHLSFKLRTEQKPRLELQGWNVPKQVITITA